MVCLSRNNNFKFASFMTFCTKIYTNSKVKIRILQCYTTKQQDKNLLNKQNEHGTDKQTNKQTLFIKRAILAITLIVLGRRLCHRRERQEKRINKRISIRATN